MPMLMLDIPYHDFIAGLLELFLLFLFIVFWGFWMVYHYRVRKDESWSDLGVSMQDLPIHQPRKRT